MLGNAPPRLPGSPSPGSPRAPAAPRHAAGSPGLCLADQLCTWPGQLYQDLQSLLHDLNVVGQIAQLVGDLRGNYQVPAAALGLESSARTVLLGLTAVGPRGCREVSRGGGVPRSRSGGAASGTHPCSADSRPLLPETVRRAPDPRDQTHVTGPRGFPVAALLAPLGRPLP